MRFNTAINAVRNSGIFNNSFVDKIEQNESFQKEVNDYLRDVNSQTSRRQVVTAIANIIGNYVDDTLNKSGTQKQRRGRPSKVAAA